MRFWDASAIVPLILDEPGRAALLELLERDSAMVVWWGTPVECVSAIARREREGHLSAAEAATALNRLKTLSSAWAEVAASEPVRNAALRMLRVHSLRAADSLQLAAAVVASESNAGSLPFVCLDDHLGDAADREGFPRLPATS